MEIVDRTSNTAGIHTNASGKDILIGRGVRDPSRIDSVVLHQTDFRTDARGNDVAAYDRVIAHFVVLPNGTVLHLRTFDALVQGPIPARAIQIETVGDFPSERGRAGSERPRAQQVRSCRDLIVWLHCVLLPQPLRHVYTHRQWSQASVGHYNCPGPHLWRSVGVWARSELGLTSTASGAAGRPIPPAWESDDFLVE